MRALLLAGFLLLAPALQAATIFTVTVTSDPVSGTAANCTAGSTHDAACSLRDAIAAVNASGTATIYFSPKVIGSITLTQGNLELTAGTGASIVGPGANILSVSGNNSSNILQVDAGATLYVSGLLFTAGNAANGGAISANGGLTVVACAFRANQSAAAGGAIYSDHAVLSVASTTLYGNTAVSSGGAIYSNTGTVTLNNSTLTGNSAMVAGGGFWSQQSVVAMTNTTIAGNQSTGSGASGSGIAGGLYLVAGTLTMANTAVAGNTAALSYADVYPFGPIVDGGGNFYGTSSSAVSLKDPGLLVLADYGGPVQTMLPQPLSPLLCEGGAAQATAAGLTLDERGAPRTTVYGTTTCVDAGAAQSNYAISFVQQPSSTTTNVAISPAPTVQWKESNAALTVAGQAIQIAATSGTLNGTTAQNTSATGVAAFSGLSLAAVQANDTLQATLPLSNTPPISVRATSGTFNVVVPVTAFTIAGLPAAATAGSAVGFTVTALQGSSVATGYTGTITISSAQDPLLAFATGGVMYTFTATDAGVHTFTTADGAVFKTAGSNTLTVSDLANNVSVTSVIIAVNAAAPAVITAVSGSGQLAPIGGTFTGPLTVKVTDAYGNVDGGVTVTFTGPVSGAGLSPASSTVMTGTDGIAALTAIANGNASTGAYTVNASVVGVSGTANFILSNTMAASHVSVAQVAPLPATSGTGVGVPTMFVATLSDATQNSAGLPTGLVQFYNGGTAIGTPVTAVNAQAQLQTTFATGGSYTITAQYLGDANFAPSSSSTLVVVVSYPAYTIELSPPSLTISNGGNASTTLTVTPTGNYQGTLTFTCNGLPQYSACLFLPTAIALTGADASQTVQLTVYTLGPGNTQEHGGVSAAWLPGLALVGLLLLGRKKLRMPGLVALLLLAGGMMGLSGCGAQHYYTPLGTAAVTVQAAGIGTAGSGSPDLNQTATLTLNVQ
jgi:predicted outer membrane repeat protein